MKNKGLWIPNEIIENKDFSLQEKFLLSLINSFSEGFFLSNSDISEIMNLSENRVSVLISELKKKGAISVHFSQHKSRFINCENTKSYFAETQSINCKNAIHNLQKRKNIPYIYNIKQKENNNKTNNNNIINFKNKKYKNDTSKRDNTRDDRGLFEKLEREFQRALE